LSVLLDADDRVEYAASCSGISNSAGGTLPLEEVDRNAQFQRGFGFG